MFKKKTQSETTINLETAINQLFADMTTVTPDSEEFSKMVVQMDVLYKLKKIDSDVDVSKHVSPDAKAAIVANIVGIAMIVGHERAHVLVSKALTFIPKIR